VGIRYESCMKGNKEFSIDVHNALIRDEHRTSKIQIFQCGAQRDAWHCGKVYNVHHSPECLWGGTFDCQLPSPT
jgi:hypothetical protein